MKTFLRKPADLTHDWYCHRRHRRGAHRLATQAAILLWQEQADLLLRADSGNHVIIINADKIALTGNQDGQGTLLALRPSWWSALTLRRAAREEPERIIKNAVKGMLPKNRLAKVQLDRPPYLPVAEHSTNPAEAPGLRDRPGLPAGQ